MYFFIFGSKERGPIGIDLDKLFDEAAKVSFSQVTTSKSMDKLNSRKTVHTPIAELSRKIPNRQR